MLEYGGARPGRMHDAALPPPCALCPAQRPRLPAPPSSSLGCGVLRGSQQLAVQVELGVVGQLHRRRGTQ